MTKDIAQEKVETNIEEQSEEENIVSTTTESQNVIVDNIEEKALDVIKGKYGNGEERRNRLGSDFEAVQQKVNELLSRN